MKRKYVLLALASVAAIAIASPVLGLDRSLKKAIKKEVAKQVSNATGPPGSQGAQGTQGQQGPVGPPVAYAYINSSADAVTEGDVDEANSLNVSDTNVTRQAVGVLCFDNLPFTFKNVVGNAETGATILAMQGVFADGGGCPGDEDLQVLQTTPPSTNSNNAFFVLFNN